MNQPPNLNELYGDRFRVTSEESLTAERGENARNTDPWLMIIPCMNGHIFPWGGEMLGASTHRPGRVVATLAKLSFVQVVQDGSDGANVAFPVTEFEAVAAIMKPRRRRRLSPEQIARQTERLRKFQFPAAAQNAGAEQIRDPSPQDVPKAA
jgi:hypothetical protein